MPTRTPAHPLLAGVAALALLAAGCNGGGSEQAPAGSPSIALSATAASFAGPSYRGELPARTVTVTNGGDGALAPPGLSIVYTQGSGWLAATVAGTSAPYTIALQPTAEGLAAGTYSATVTVASAGASGGPRSISVTLTLTPTWTVFVYGHADGDRPMAFVRDLQEMSEASLGDAVTLIVAADYPAGRPMPAGESFPTGTEWYRILGAGMGAVLLGTAEEQNFDDPAVLQAAVANALHAYPSDRYAVVLWGHGASWRGFGGDEQDTPADPTDDGAGLSAAAIGGALSAALVDLGRATPLELVAFDASSMMGQEVAYELRDVASVLVASAEAELGGGWDYATTLGRLGSDPSLPPAALAAAEVQDWEAHHAGPADLLVRAHGAVDLTQLASYTAGWQGLSTAITGSATLDWLELARRLYAATPGYSTGVPAHPEPRTSLRDAGQLLRELGQVVSDPVVAASAGTALTSLDALVVSSSTGALRLADEQAGVHGEGTIGPAWFADAPTYQLLGWHTATAWGDVLELLAGQADGAPPELIVLSENTEAPDAVNPPRIHVASPDADVADARLSIAAVEGSSVVSRGVYAEFAVAPGAPAEQRDWDGNLPGLSDGITSSDVFVRPWIRGPSGAAFLLPGTIRDGDASLEAYAILVGGAESVDSVAVAANGSLAVLPLADFGGLSFTPALFDETLGAWGASANPLTIPQDPAASLSFQRRSAPAGAYRILTSLSDVWGNVSGASTDVTVVAPFGT